MSQVLPFSEVLEAADHLTQDEQLELVAILNRRLAQAGRVQVIADVQDARKEFLGGKCNATTSDEIMREILK